MSSKPWHDTCFAKRCNVLLRILIFIVLAAVCLLVLSRLTRPRPAPGSAGRPPASTMDSRQACAILGLDEQHLDQQTVIEAHRRLMQRVHPDKGGSAALAQQLNEAKRVLLQKLNG